MFLLRGALQYISEPQPAKIDSNAALHWSLFWQAVAIRSSFVATKGGNKRRSNSMASEEAAAIEANKFALKLFGPD